jgi:ribosomal-protein-alanine N-acetyltransferase
VTTWQRDLPGEGAKVLITTNRLALRPLDVADRSIYVALYTNADVMRHIGVPLDPHKASVSFDKACALQVEQLGFPSRWILRRTGAREAAGLMGVFKDPHGESAEVGVMLLPDAQGQGLAAEAIRAMASHAFGEGWVRSLWARHSPANAAMQAVLESLTFHAESGLQAERRWRLTQHEREHDRCGP